MPIHAPANSKPFTPAPEGLHHAVCVDVIDLGAMETPFGIKHKIDLIWQLGDDNPVTGLPYQVRKRYTLSAYEKAPLRLDVESWFSKRFKNDEQATAFDFEQLIGKNCQVQIIHNLGKNGTTWANVQAVVPAPKNVPLLRAREYTRQVDKAKDGSPMREREDESDIPF